MRSLGFALLLLASGVAYGQINSPKISVNSLMSYQFSNLNAEDQSRDPNGFRLRETEVAFISDVDPYSKLTLILAIHPEYELNNADQKIEESWLIEPEEAFAESTYVDRLTLKGGKFRAAFGKSNAIHTHALPFYDAPLANVVLLGEEGLNDVGVSASYLLPFSFYSDLTAQILRGGGENSQFSSESPNDSLGLIHTKNLWDLSDASTLEWGASFAQGANSVGGNTNLYGMDLTFKWRPVANAKSKSLIVSTEWIGSEIKGNRLQQDEKKDGFNTWAQLQWKERWYSGIRYDNVESTERLTLTTEFRATEFSSFRLDLSRAQAMDDLVGVQKDENKVSLQANFTIGSHPAHSY